MGDNVGTLRKVTLDGVTFDIMLDTNITFNYSKFEIEGQATTGKTLMKRTKRVQTIESLGLAVNPTELDDLKSKADSLADKTFSIELADGSIFKATGQINLENYESESGKATVILIPSKNWTPFLAD